jgi:hypothetical protein
MPDSARGRPWALCESASLVRRQIGRLIRLLQSVPRRGNLAEDHFSWRIGGATAQRATTGAGDRRRWGAEDGDEPPGTKGQPRFSTLSESSIARRAFGLATVRGQVVRLAIAVSLIAISAACSSGDGDDTSTTRRSQSTPSSTISANEQVLSAYRGFWDAYLAAADPMDPLSARLADHATGAELETVRKAFVARKSGGEVIRGTLDLAPRVVSVVGESATVRDCYLDNTGIYDAATGARKDTATGVRHLITASLVREGTAWKVSELKKESDGCTAA